MRQAIFAILMLLPSAAFSAPQDLEFVCSYTVARTDGMFEIVTSQSLRVLEQVSNSQTFMLPPDAPKNISAIMCARTSPIPVVGDALVLRAGYSLYLAAPGDNDEQILYSLKLSGNKVTYNMISGSFNQKQLSELGKVILQMDSTYFSHPPAQP